MSTLSQFAPFAGGGIKSIQQGLVSTSLPGGTSGGTYLSANYTISAVNTAKAIPAFQGAGRIGSGGLYNDGSNMAAILTSSTNVQVGNYVLYGGWWIYGRWYVVESN